MTSPSPTPHPAAVRAALETLTLLRDQMRRSGGSTVTLNGVQVERLVQQLSPVPPTK